MGKSIITEDMQHCFICGRPKEHIHHVFFGTSNRKLSDKHGLIVPLCYEHHEGNYGVHRNKAVDSKLKQLGQRKFEEAGYTRQEFMQIFGKSYL